MFSLVRVADVARAHAADADAGDVQLLAGRLLALTAKHVAGNDRCNGESRAGDEHLTASDPGRFHRQVS